MPLLAVGEMSMGAIICEKNQKIPIIFNDSGRTIAGAMPVSRQTAKRALIELCQRGFLKWYARALSI
jgi:DNA-binding transcriptional regulator YhcF (GntR family)